MSAGAPAYTEQHYKDRAAWLEARRQTIGGSDAPAVVGLDPWTSPAKLYAIKAGLITEDQEQSEAMEMGSILEPVIRNLYQERTGRLVIGPRPWLVRRSSLHPFMSYSPDGWAIDPARGDGHESRGVLQCKAVNEFKGREWDEEPPLHYLVQLQHEIAVEGATWGVLAAIIGGRRFRYFEYERHPPLIAGLIEREQEFYSRLQEGIAPPVDGSASSTAMLRAMYPVDTGGVVMLLPDEAIEWDRRRQEACEEIKRWQAQKDEADNQIKAAIGAAEVGMLPGGPGMGPGLASYSWKATTYKYKATAAREEMRRVLRRKDAS